MSHVSSVVVDVHESSKCQKVRWNARPTSAQEHPSQSYDTSSRRAPDPRRSRDVVEPWRSFPRLLAAARANWSMHEQTRNSTNWSMAFAGTFQQRLVANLTMVPPLQPTLPVVSPLTII
ncbi:hypothetical protein N7539_007993 [Penicillium diatomitis]|uniref:Uncharacterized protein n=1 Tax=Penicillium diatomitis TaxID=2819901 RepID=A0A9X0BNI2_9EURO|nr:uncharacterized protein N7539_007993 [Penicillium diatomitis]KAJ5475706.1 hypothetical protein N7539_007993 [Penicillium diatomitis]